jgi:hypothetical protein
VLDDADDARAVADILDAAFPPGEAPDGGPPPRIFEDPDDARHAKLTRVVEGIGSQDPATRAAASAAVDTYLKKRGLAWKDIADAIEVMSAVENWQSEEHERTTRRDTQWTRFVDREDRAGYGRWMKGRALTVRITKFMGSSWFAAINGHVIRDWNHKPRLFRSAAKGQSAIEAFANGELN